MGLESRGSAGGPWRLPFPLRGGVENRFLLPTDTASLKASERTVAGGIGDDDLCLDLGGAFSLRASTGPGFAIIMEGVGGRLESENLELSSGHPSG